MTMQACVKMTPQRGLTLASMPMPTYKDNEVLVKIKASSICGTDLHIYEMDSWAQQRVKKFPLIQGHEFCGVVVEKGKAVRELAIGDYVSAESHVIDFNGDYFKRNLGHVAPETEIIGVDRDGSFAEYIALPWQNFRKNPSNMPLNVAVLKENFGNAVHLTHKVNLENKVVLISGCGPVGLMSILILKAIGVKYIIASDVSEYRRNFAKQLGADQVINPMQEPLVEVVRARFPNGVDAFLDLSGSPKAIQEGLSVLDYAGHMIAFGIPSQPLTLDWGKDLIFKGITIHAVVGRLLWSTWELTESLLDTGRVDLSPIVTHQFGMKVIDEAFATFKSGNSGKIMITMEH